MHNPIRVGGGQNSGCVMALAPNAMIGEQDSASEKMGTSISWRQKTNATSQARITDGAQRLTRLVPKVDLRKSL